MALSLISIEIFELIAPDRATLPLGQDCGKGTVQGPELMGLAGVVPGVAWHAWVPLAYDFGTLLGQRRDWAKNLQRRSRIGRATSTFRTVSITYMVDF